MSELTQLKKLMEAIDESQFDDEPFIQAHNLPGDSIIDKYKAGKISYEQAEDMLSNQYHDSGDLEMAMAELNTAYSDTEVEWDEETGSGVVREADNTDADYNINVLSDADGDMYVEISAGEHVVATMDVDVWEGLANQYRRISSQII